MWLKQIQLINPPDILLSTLYIYINHKSNLTLVQQALPRTPHVGTRPSVTARNLGRRTPFSAGKDRSGSKMIGRDSLAIAPVPELNHHFYGWDV